MSESARNIDGFAAVILAAGASRRMGSPKMLLPFDSGTILQHVVGSYLTVLDSEKIIVVTGGDHARVSASVASMGVKIIYNERSGDGMQSSVQAGISRAAKLAPNCFLALGDQPLIKPQTIRQLAESHLHSKAVVTQPTYLGKGGHPIVIASHAAEQILALGPSDTLKSFVNKHAVNKVEVDDPFVLKDVDTPEDYEKLIQTRSETCSLVEIS